MAEEVSDDLDAYETVTCLACRQVHLVNPTSGKVLRSGRGIGGCNAARIQAAPGLRLKCPRGLAPGAFNHRHRQRGVASFAFALTTKP